MMCFKCGTEEGQIVKHHLGYSPEVLVDCCKSCHVKIHARLRRNNQCSLSVEEAEKLSQESYRRRNRVDFYKTIATNVQLVERIKPNGSVLSYFKFR